MDCGAVNRGTSFTAGSLHAVDVKSCFATLNIRPLKRLSCQISVDFFT